jgi:hypothetical protein
MEVDATICMEPADRSVLTTSRGGGALPILVQVDNGLVSFDVEQH